MIKLVEVSQKVSFQATQNIRSTTVSVPWTAVLAVALVGPFVVTAFRRPVAPVTNLFSVPKDSETEQKPSVEKKAEDS